MKRLMSSTAIVAVMALCGFVGSAHAVSFTENYWSAGQPNAPLYFTVAPSYLPTPTFVQNVSGSSSGVERSPYELNTDGFAAAFYSVLAPGGQNSPAQAI